MNLKEQIRRILKEERSMNIGLRRRLVILDDNFYGIMNEVYRRDNICGYSSGEQLLDVVIEAAVEFMFFNSFQHFIDDNTGEWGEIYYEMVEYIKSKYGKEIIQYYRSNCRK
jgi:hypothetical protein